MLHKFWPKVIPAAERPSAVSVMQRDMEFRSDVYGSFLRHSVLVGAAGEDDRRSSSNIRDCGMPCHSSVATLSPVINDAPADFLSTAK